MYLILLNFILKYVKIANFMLCILYYNKKITEKNITGNVLLCFCQLKDG